MAGRSRAINYEVRSLVAKTDLGERTFLLTPDCTVFLGGESVTFDDLRRGDVVQISFDSPDAVSPEAKQIAATRPADTAKWAVVVAAANFDDSSVGAFPAAAEAAGKLQRVLTDRYAVPPDQVIMLVNPSRVRLEQGLADAIGQSGQAQQLLVLLAGRIAIGSDGLPRVVPKDFAAARADDSGVPLAPLLTLVENSPAKQKIVLLDLQGAGSASGGGGAPASAASLFELVRGTRNKPLLKTTHVIAAAGQPVACREYAGSPYDGTSNGCGRIGRPQSRQPVRSDRTSRLPAGRCQARRGAGDAVSARNDAAADHRRSQRGDPPPGCPDGQAPH